MIERAEAGLDGLWRSDALFVAGFWADDSGPGSY